MGQKVNPHGLRVGVIKDWDSRWYASEEKVGDLIVEDQKIRKYLKKTLYGAGVPKIEIERSNDIVTIYLHCARPGVVIGKGGEQIEQYRLAVEKMIGKKVKLNIVEVRNPDMNAQLVPCAPAPRAARFAALAVWVAARSLALSTITRAPSPCRPSAPTLSTASRRLPRPSAASV